MTTITVERELLEQALDALSAPNYRVFSESPICVGIRAALAAPATASEKTVKEIMEFARHYAANTFSSATLEDKIRRSLATPATTPERKPMPILEVNARWEQSVLGITRLQYYQVIREVEASHGIKETP